MGVIAAVAMQDPPVQKLWPAFLRKSYR